MTSEYVLRKNRKKGGKSTRGPPGIGFNLTENGDYDIAGHKLVNVKQPENPGDAVNLQYLASANDNMIKKDDSESVLKIVKPELSNMIKKDDSESVLKIVKPELSNMIKKDDSESVLKIVRRNLDSLNLSIRKNYIGVGNRRIVKTADAIDKYDVVNKDVRTLKRFGGWKSDTVVEGYVEDSLQNKIGIAKKILGNESSSSTSIVNHEITIVEQNKEAGFNADKEIYFNNTNCTINVTINKN
jgi:hypothetical protein